MKCEVLVDKITLVVNKGSLVDVDEQQFELARQFIRPVNDEHEEKPKRKPKQK